jgi:hypothetical protein
MDPGRSRQRAPDPAAEALAVRATVAVFEGGASAHRAVALRSFPHHVAGLSMGHFEGNYRTSSSNSGSYAHPETGLA